MAVGIVKGGNNDTSSLPAFLDSTRYTVYDNFDSYSTATFTTNTNWTVGSGNGGSCEITASTNAGGANKEVDLKADADASGASATITTKLLLPKNTWCRLKPVFSSTYDTGSCKITFGGTSYTFATGQGTASAWTSIMIINTAIEAYDVYIGGKLFGSLSSISDASAQLAINIRNTNSNTDAHHHLYVDDVRQW